MLLQKRSNGVYYFRWVYPLSLKKLLRKRELYFSLHTRSKSQALARAGVFYMTVNQFRVIQDRFERGVITRAEYDSEAYEHFMGLYTGGVVKDLELHVPKTHEELVKLREKTDELLGRISDSRLNLDAEVASGLTAEDMFFDHVMTHPTCEGFRVFGETIADHPTLLARFKKDLVSLFHWILGQLKVKLEVTSVPPSLPSYMLTKIGISEGPLSISRSAGGISFSCLCDEFLNHKLGESALSDKLQAEYKAIFPVFTYFLGDKLVQQIQRVDVEQCLVKCKKLPLRNKRAYKGKGIEELAVMEVPAEDRLSPKTVDNYRKLMQGIFSYAKRKGYVESSPALNLELGLKIKLNRGAFSNPEVVKLVTAALRHTSQSFKWIVTLGAYTGARLGEIVQLRKKDVRQEEGTGIWYIHISEEAGDLKTENAQRVVPLHSKLQELGFLAFVEGCGDILFPDMKPKSVTGRFPLFREKAGVLPKNLYGMSLSFHSLRHSFVTNLRSKGATDIQVQRVIGHEVTGAGVTDVYTHNFSLEDLFPIIEKVTYL